jgi:hypothetical protein
MTYKAAASMCCQFGLRLAATETAEEKFCIADAIFEKFYNRTSEKNTISKTRKTIIGLMPVAYIGGSTWVWTSGYYANYPAATPVWCSTGEPILDHKSFAWFFPQKPGPQNYTAESNLVFSSAMPSMKKHILNGTNIASFACEPLE